MFDRQIMLRRIAAGSLSALLVFQAAVAPVLAEEDAELHEHTWETCVTMPTCTEDGLESSICTECGAAAETVLPALGHDFSDSDGTCVHCGAAPEERSGDAEASEIDPQPEPQETEAPEEEALEVCARVEPAASYSGEGAVCEYYAYTLPDPVLWAFGHLDPGYTGCAVTNLTEQEAQSIKNAILLAQGEDPTACVVAAQVIHDQYVYLGGQYASFRDLRYLLMRCWDESAWSEEWVNPDDLDTAAAEFAFDYIFVQGNAFLPHDLTLAATLPEPEWDPQALFPGAEPIALFCLRSAPGEEPAEDRYIGLWGHSDYDSDGLFAGQYNPNASLRWSTGSRLSTREDIQAELTRLLYDSGEGVVTCDFDGYTEITGRHEGIDFCLEEGAPVYSLIDGVILRVSRSSELSTLAIYDETRDKTVVYLHCALSAGLREGDPIHRGDFVGTESACGANEPHTHVEVVEGESGWANISVAVQGSETYELGITLENEDPYYYWAQVLGGGSATGVLRHMTDHPITIQWPWPGLEALLPPEEPETEPVPARSVRNPVKTGAVVK